MIFLQVLFANMKCSFTQRHGLEILPWHSIEFMPHYLDLLLRRSVLYQKGALASVGLVVKEALPQYNALVHKDISL